MGKREFIVLISLLMALTALAIDMMLPAFGQMRADLGLPADSAGTALVVTAFLVGFGLGQPLWGPLSDALGRKPILWVGLAVYGAAALGAALAPSLAVLLVLRFVAGLGAAAVRVITLGSLRDRYKGDQMAKILSYIMAIFLLVPMVAPSIGALLVAFGDWHWVFGFFAVAALVTAAWSLRLPETLPAERRLPLDLGELLTALRLVLSSRFTMGFTLAGLFVFGFFASYLASSERIIDDVFGMGGWFPLIFGGSSLVLGAAVLFNPRLIDRFGLRRMVRYAITANVGAMVVLVAVAVASGGRPPFWLYMASMLPILVAHSFVMPNLNSAALLPMGRMAGTAAAVIGSVSALGGAVVGAVIDRAFDGTVTPFAVGGLIAIIAASLCYRWADAVWERDAGLVREPATDEASAAMASSEVG